MKKLILFIAIVALNFNAMAQVKNTDTVNLGVRDTSMSTPFTDHFFSGFMVRKSFQTPDQALNPGLFQITIPQTGKINWLVDAGLGVTIGKLSSHSFTSNIIGEFHRNTIADSQQYNYQLGYNFVYQNTRNSRNITPVFTGNVKYIKDFADSGHSVAGTLNISLYRAGKDRLDIGRPGFLSDYKFTYQLDPSFETQYQQVLASDKGIPGAIIRPMINLSASIAFNRPLTKKIMFPQKLIELGFDYDNRYAIVNSVHNGEGYSKLFTGRFAYYFFNTATANAALGASYNLGSDPLNGLKDQRFWRFSLQFQL